MVRRATASSFPMLARSVDPATAKADLAPLFNSLASDDQDSVRLLMIDAAASIIAQGVPNVMIFSFFSFFLNSFTTDFQCFCNTVP